MTTQPSPGPLIGRGRAADVFDIGGGRVLRRNRGGASTEREAQVMTHVRNHGYPAPEVFDHHGADLVMERVDGPTMLDAFARRPWRLARWARLLASLHEALSEVPLPDFDVPETIGPAEAIAHGDLHPGNVLLSSRGPVVIDWPNAALAARGVDVAQTWILLFSGAIDAPGAAGVAQHAGRALFLRLFLGHCDREQARTRLSAAAARRRVDPNVLPGEIERIDLLLRREGPP